MLRIVLILFCLLSQNSAYAEEKYDANTGDVELDAALHQMNTNVKNHINKYVSSLANEYQVPDIKIRDLIKLHKFTPADCFMTVAIADVTGQPVDMVSRAYLEHKAEGWGYITEQLRMGLGTDEFEQLKSDIEIDFIK